MRYQKFQPNPILSKYIECFWLLESNGEKSTLAPQRILPDGCVELLFHCKSRNRRFISVNKTVDEPRSFINGQIKRYIKIEPTGAMAVFGIRFRPSGAYPFLHTSIKEFTEKIVSLDLIWGKEGGELETRILESPTSREKIQQAESFLLEKLDQKHKPDLITNQALMKIIRSKGQLSMDSLLRNIGLSGRQLERKFSRLVGLTPKNFSRIIRFQNIFELFNKNSFQALTALALESGFYDQAHFNHEFKDFTGQSPTAYFSEEQKMAALFTSPDRMSNFYNSA